MGRWSNGALGTLLLAACIGLPCTTAAQAVGGGQVATEARRITVSWNGAPIRDVLMAFAAFSGKSIVPGPNVVGAVTADINDRPWDVALRAILATRGWVAFEDESGIIRVEDLASLSEREALEPLITRAYRISYARAEEIQATLAPLLSGRGSISVNPSTNTVVVSDVARVHRMIGGVIRRPGRRDDG